jgi:ABC-2 type transport system ATP-binding protein
MAVMTGTQMAAVETRGLTRLFKRRVALDHATLEVRAGEILGLVGPNGAGKTTLLRVLCAILRPTAGVALVLGHDVVTEPDEVRRRIGYMSQAFSLYTELTIAENLAFYGDVYGVVSPRRYDDVCAMVGLDAHEAQTVVGQLPTGRRQRAALAAAVLHSPALLFLDEPTSGVDPAGRRDFWSLMRTLAGAGTTIVVSTHVMAEAERCDRVALMAEGRVLACDTPEQLRRSAGSLIAGTGAPPVPQPSLTFEEAFVALVRQRELHPNPT